MVELVVAIGAGLARVLVAQVVLKVGRQADRLTSQTRIDNQTRHLAPSVGLAEAGDSRTGDGVAVGGGDVLLIGHVDRVISVALAVVEKLGIDVVVKTSVGLEPFNAIDVIGERAAHAEIDPGDEAVAVADKLRDHVARQTAGRRVLLERADARIVIGDGERSHYRLRLRISSTGASHDN